MLNQPQIARINEMLPVTKELNCYSQTLHSELN